MGRHCWCGNTDLAPFSSDYGACRICGTLVSQNSLSDEQLSVKDDETDFYGKQYWLAHQSDDLGFPSIYARARNDLTERNLHWLKTLLKYQLPPANVLELGCSQGSFVALLQQAGYGALGIEMSPWVVSFGRETFKVPIEVGPVETLNLPQGSFDVIALMDVLEHLPDPLGTIGYCVNLLKPGGLLLIQTPDFQEGTSQENLIEIQSPFLEQLKTDEHLYLFSQRAVHNFFQRLQCNYVQFEPAIFADYDMFFVASKMPLNTYSEEQWQDRLMQSSQGRMTLALLDLRDRELALMQKLQESEQDRAARLEQIFTLTEKLKESELDRVARFEQIQSLTELFQELEQDPTALLEQINLLSQQLHSSEQDRTARLEQIHKLTQQLQESEQNSIARLQQVHELTQQLQESEQNSIARLQQVHELTQQLQESEQDRIARLEQIQTLTEWLKQAQIKKTRRRL